MVEDWPRQKGVNLTDGSLDNATIHTDSVLLYVSQTVLEFFFLVVLLNSRNEKLCPPSVVEGDVVKMPNGTVCLK